MTKTSSIKVKYFKSNGYMRRIVIILTLAIIPLSRIFAGDFHWRGGSGNWSDPTMWESRSITALSGSLPSRSDNVYIDRTDAQITIDKDISVENLYWKYGKITGTSEKTISVHGSVFIDGAAIDNFSGSWSLVSSQKGTFEADVELQGAITVEASGNILLHKPLKTAKNFVVKRGNIDFSSSIECDSFVFAESGEQIISFNNATIISNKLEPSNNPERKIENNSVVFKHPMQDQSRTLAVNVISKHYCSGTQGSVYISATTSPSRFFRISISCFDTSFNPVGAPYTYNHPGKTTSLEHSYTLAPQTNDIVMVTINVHTYKLSVGSGNADTWSQTFTLYKLPDLELGIHNITDVTTADGNDGAITVNATGGTLNHANVPAPLTYTLSPGTTQNTPTFSGLTAGSYDLTVSNSDHSTCPDVTQSGIVVSAPPPPAMSITNVDVTNETPCSNSNNGSITITVTNASGLPEFSIDNGNSWSSSNVFNDVQAGSYVCKAKDTNGEVVWGPVNITQPDDITVTGTPSVTHVTVQGGNNGQIEVAATGPNLPLTYAIDGATTNNTGIFTGLTAGEYTITITDGMSCPAAQTGTIAVNEPTPGPFVLDSTFTQPVTCRNDLNGIVRFYVSGGSLPYSFKMTSPTPGSWQSSNEFTNLTSGSYEFEMRDNAGSVLQSGKITLLNPQQLNITNVSITSSLLCHGDLTGSIEISVTGGHTPYSYSIDDKASWHPNNTFTGLGIDQYEIWVRDKYGCTIGWGNENISGPAPLVINNVIATDVTDCYEANNGTIRITASGGTGTIRFSVDGTNYLNNGGNFINLAVGTYPVSVRDHNNCVTNYGNVNIGGPAKLEYTISKVDVTGCNGETTGSITVNATGGTGTLQYSINDGGTWQLSNVFSGLAAGTYKLKVKDVNNCTKGEDVVITEPSVISIAGTTSTNITCNNANDGTITVAASGGTEPLTYTITGGTSNNTGSFTGLAAGSYSVTVTDANNCAPVISSTVTIVNPDAITITGEASTNVTCHDTNNGTITITANGGTAPLTYTITGGTSNNTGAFTGLAAGSYSVTVTDVNNCASAISSNIIITNPDAITITNETLTNITCHDANNGTITITAEGGTAPLTYKINGGISNTTGIFTGLAAGTYTVTVNDANSCAPAISSTLNIINPAPLAISSVAHTQITCNGANNGTIKVSATGGTGLLTYSINGGQPSNTDGVFMGLSAGTYQVSVTDENGCGPITTSNVVLTDPTAIVINSESFTQISCHNANDGSITINAVGGTPPLIYTITGGTSNGTGVFTGLAAGSYTVSVTDSKNCTPVVSSNITITNPDAITIANEAFTNITCNNANDGTITITANGGTAPLTYTITGGTSNNTGAFTGLAAGAYKVTVTDASGCPGVVSSNITITNPDAITIANEVFTNITCNNANDGTITITANGGTAPLTYTINGGTSNNSGTFTDLAAGVYQVTVTDVNNCSSVTSTSISITNPDLITIIGEASTNITCNNANDGTITITANGGTAPLTYTINGGTSNNSGTFTDLAAGVYQVTVTDVNNCSSVTSTSITITNPDAITITGEAFTNITCNNANDGTITITANGGTAPLTYSISGVPLTNSTGIFTGLKAGVYTISVTDVNNCNVATSSSITINNPTPLNILGIPTSTDLTCNGSNDGTITVNATGGTIPYTFSINGGYPDNNDGIFTGLAAGTYTVSITDANNCGLITTTAINITEPTAITINGTSSTNITCFGANDGTITITTSGGSSPLSYTLTGNITNTTGSFTNLSAGTYNVTVIDANNCAPVISSDITISEPAAITIVSEDAVNLTCNGSGNVGKVIVTATGGVGNLTYDIGNGSPQLNNGTFENLAVGSYTVTITDDNSCSITSSTLTISEPDKIVVTLVDSVYSCGSLPVIEASQIFLPDGTGVTYTSTINHTDFDPSATVQNVNDIESIALNMEHSYVGELTIRVVCPDGKSLVLTDKKGGDKNLGEPVRDPADDDLNPGIGYSYIFNEDATYSWITVPDVRYTYVDLSGNLQTNERYIPAGSYKPEGTFSSLVGCPLNGDWKLEVTDHFPLDNGYLFKWNLNFAPSTFPSGYCNGMATINATGGTGNLTYLWSNGNTTNTITNLCADTYTVTVTDENSCSVTKNVVIEDVNIQMNVTDITHVTCAGSQTGSLTVEATGGNQPYAYTWNTGANGPTLSNLSAGRYYVTITDANLCQKYDSIDINTINQIVTVFSDIVPAACNNANGGSHTGSAKVEATGGTGEYQYQWSSGENTQTATNLVIGWNHVTVTDEQNCSKIDSVEIIQPTKLEITSIDITNVTCNGAADGAITIAVAGGTGATAIDWLLDNVNIGNGTTLTAQKAGTYTLRISDANSCTIPDTAITISQPDSIDFTITVTPSACNTSNGTASVTAITGGNGSETITWFDNGNNNIGTGNTIANIGVGQYSVKVEDVKGCYATKTFEIENNSDLTIDGFTWITPVSCNGQCDGKAQINVTSTAAIASYAWSTGSISDTEENLCGGTTVSITVTDANGCSADTTITVPQPEILKVDNVTLTHNQCYGNNDGAATANVIGGTIPYTFVWKDSEDNTLPTTENTITQLNHGKYYVTVTDNNNCQVVDSLEINPAAQITVSVVTTQTGCGTSQGTATLTPTNGVEPYQYIWPEPYGTTTQQQMTGLAAGNYTVTVQDAIGCQATQAVIITDDSNIAINIEQINDPSCFNGCDGSANVSSTGGTGLITYVWMDDTNNIVSNSSAADNLCGGKTYTVKALDVNNCTAEILVTIGNPTPITAVATVNTPLICHGASNGEAIISATGGNGGPYAFLWPDGSTLDSRNDLVAGDYTVTVSEGACQTTVALTINQRSQITFTYEIVEANCQVNNGSITLSNTQGGSGSGYTYAWSNPAWTTDSTGNAITNLGFGQYTLTITDDLGCTRDTTFNINNNSDLKIDSITMETPVSCFGDCNGKVKVTASSSAAITAYAWSTGSNSDTEENVCGGATISVTVTDANGCSVSQTYTVPQPEEITIAITAEHNNCYGGNTGSATATATGGTGNLTYNWANESGTAIAAQAQVNSLTAGKYYLTVTDQNNCSKVDSVTINDGIEIAVTSIVTPATCGQANGSVTITATSGTEPYTYHWPNPIGDVTTPTVTSLGLGIYYVTVEDANNCESIHKVHVTDIGGMVINIDNTVAATCYGANNGEATVSVVGGTGLITITWKDSEGNVIPGGNTATNLLGGSTYYVTAIDENNCGAIEEIYITQPAELVLTATNIHNASCFGQADGQATIEATGGNGAPYTYAWSDGNNTSNTRNDLKEGVYTVTVTDAQNCQKTIEVTITQPAEITYIVEEVKPTCGQNNGSLTVSSISGGTGTTYNVAWSNSNWTSDSIGTSIVNLVVGTYNVSVTDSTGCSTTQTIILQSNTDMTAETVDIQHVNCSGEATGSATIAITGGTPVYTITWNNGQTGTTINDLVAGTYTATITDAANCTINHELTIGQNAPLVTNTVFTEPIVCAGDTIASLYMAVTGGVAPYTYNWTDTAGTVISTDSTMANIKVGKYYITVTDNVGCSTKDSVIITTPTPIEIAFATTQTNCTSATGTVKATITGGVAPYILQWKKFDNPTATIEGNGTDSIYNLGVGYYVLSVTDSLGCNISDTTQVESNTTMKIYVTNTVGVTCLGRPDGRADINIENGIAPYTIIWANGDTVTNVTETTAFNNALYQGDQVVKVIDNSGCEQDKMFHISIDNALYVTLRSYPDVGGDLADFGFVRASAFGGIEPYTYNWENAQGQNVGNTAKVNNLNYGWYFVTVTDANPNPCQWIDSIEVENRSISYDTIFINHATCNGADNGSISIKGKGGDEPYTYRWRNDLWTADSLGNTITNLVAGQYRLTLTDTWGFVEVIDTLTITQPEPLGLTVVVLEPTSCNNPTGVIAAQLPDNTGAVAPITYSWWNVNWTTNVVLVDNPKLENVGLGTYHVTVTDANGCTAVDSIEMTDNSPIVLRLNIINHPLCFESSTGELEARVTPTTITNLIYSWSHNPTLNSPNATQLAAGEYSVTVTDATTTCQRVASATLIDPEKLEFSIIDTIQPTCYNDQDGSVTIQATGGTAPYKVSIHNPALNTTVVVDTTAIDNLSAGAYILQVIDGNNCTTEKRPLNLLSKAPYMTVGIEIDEAPSCNKNIEDGKLRATVIASEHPNTAPLDPQPDISNYSFKWSNDSIGQILNGIGLGSYHLTVTNNEYGCTADNSILIKFAKTNISANATLDKNGNIVKDSTVCIGDTVNLISNYDITDLLANVIAKADSIKWTSGNSIAHKPISDTVEYYSIATRHNGANKYYVTVYSNGCYDTDSLTAHNHDLNDVKVSAYKIDPNLGEFNGVSPLVSIFTGSSALVKIEQFVTDNTTYDWSERYHTRVEGLGEPNSIVKINNDKTALIVKPIDSTIYTVVAKTKVYPEIDHYCVSKDEVLVRVLGEFNPPNAFTPNGDGYNDTWKMEGFKLFNSVTVQIYNRWGQLVFESSDPNSEWDGTNKKGKDLPVGTYYYIINYTTDSYSKKISGPITIIR